jgi:hypothetical protein
MGRLLLLLLVLTNAVYWAHTQAWWAPIWRPVAAWWGGSAPAGTEPQRLQQQLRADQVEVRAPDGTVRPVVGVAASGAAVPTAGATESVGPSAAEPAPAISAPAAPAPAPAPAPTQAPPTADPASNPARANPGVAPDASAAASVAATAAARLVAGATAAPATPTGPAPRACQRVGLLDERTAAAVRERLQRTPAATWRLENGVQNARWIVYMGRYPDADLLARKRAELRARKVPFEPVRNAALEPGLSLGGFDTLGEAVNHLDALTERGVRTARVVQERPERRGIWLVAPEGPLPPPAPDAIRPLLGDRVWEPCG